MFKAIPVKQPPVSFCNTHMLHLPSRDGSRAQPTMSDEGWFSRCVSVVRPRVVPSCRACSLAPALRFVEAADTLRP